jgi:hypothetical protein
VTEPVPPRVFVSSVIIGFEDYREAAANGIGDAGGEAIRVETFPSLSVSPRVACLDAIAKADAIIVIIGPRPGFLAPSGKYVIEEEWQYARTRSTPVYVFIQDQELEPDAARIAKELSEYVHGRFRRVFKTPEELRSEVATALSGITSRMTATPDTTRFNQALAQRSQGGYETFVRLAIQPIRIGEMIDPLDLDSRAFQDGLLQLGSSGSRPLFSLRAKKTVHSGTSSIEFDQPDESGRDPEQYRANAQIYVDGLTVVERAASSSASRGWSDSISLGVALKLSDLEAATASLFSFVAAAYNHLDRFIAFRDFIYNVALVNLGMRYIYDAIPPSGQGIPVRMSDNNNILAFDSPRPIVREALDDPTAEIDRVVALLRRRAQHGV